MEKWTTRKIAKADIAVVFSVFSFPHFSLSPFLLFFFIAFAFSLLGCQRPPERRYELSGIVEAVDTSNKTITIKHDDIPGYMDAMTMPFSLKDEWVYKAVTVGDQLRAQLVVQGDRAWLEAVSITQQNPPDKTPAAVEATSEFTPYPASDFTLTDQDGRAFSLHDLRGKTVLLDFIFTRCPGPCPLLSLKFSRVQQKLGERFGKEVFLLSVTIDPRHDTPPILKEYAQRYTANLTGWTFLTGSTKDIILTASAFGADYEANEDGIVDHRLVTSLIDPQGMVVAQFTGTAYSADDLLSAIERLHTRKSQ